jgi:hypothetical protein
MLGANFNKSLVGMMFHADFKQHLRALDLLVPFAEADPEALVANLDLLLKWMTLRFFETNPSVNIKAPFRIQKSELRIPGSSAFFYLGGLGMRKKNRIRVPGLKNLKSYFREHSTVKNFWVKNT